MEGDNNSTRNTTNDRNVIGEAQTKYLDYSWMYFHRPHHNGAEDSFENHKPNERPQTRA
jgi:hypothetical protein